LNEARDDAPAALLPSQASENRFEVMRAARACVAKCVEIGIVMEGRSQLTTLATGAKIEIEKWVMVMKRVDFSTGPKVKTNR
jgi:hypothetical protein